MLSLSDVQSILNFHTGNGYRQNRRMVDALQFNEEHGEVCPADWHKGEKALKATQEGIADFLGNK